jgi:hypothetical protein
VAQCVQRHALFDPRAAAAASWNRRLSWRVVIGLPEESGYRFQGFQDHPEVASYVALEANFKDKRSEESCCYGVGSRWGLGAKAIST